VNRAVGHPPRLKLRAAQALVDATSLPAERREQRIGALGSLGRSTVTAVITIVAALTVLTELGFNITTIVAGTSIVAVTIAFGVQSIVKDLVSGIFMLVEDQLGVGDFVDMEKASGVVESIGLRVTQLRDDYGTVWYVRNGEVVRVGNFSQGGPGRPPGTEAPPAVTPPATPAP
jgi:small conductance mechanosensitive channel